VSDAAEGRGQFTGADGTFVFTNLPRGRYFVKARKPGFLNEQELARGRAVRLALRDVPASGVLVLKLTPEGVIYGEVKNEAGEPVERVAVSAQRWLMADGRRRLLEFGNTTTDDEGKYRIAEVLPGTYQLSFGPENRSGAVLVEQLRGRKTAEQGYAREFYPGVADADSATAIEVRAGAQVHIAQSLKRQRLYEVAGVVRGAGPAGFVRFRLFNRGGDRLERAARFEPGSGQFKMSGIPAGTYVLDAWTADPNESGRMEVATESLHVNADVSGVVLTFGPGNSLTVQVRDEIPPDGTNQARQVTVMLHPKGLEQYTPAVTAPTVEGDGGAAGRIEEVPPGTYTVEATPHVAGYVASLRSGNVDLLRDDLTVAPGSALAPIEVTLRNDGAQLSVAVTENGQAAAGGVVIYSEEYPRRSLVLLTDATGAVSAAMLAPGRYQVVAVEDALDLEFRNPAAMEKYLARATGVTLTPGDKVSVQIELQKPGERQP